MLAKVSTVVITEKSGHFVLLIVVILNTIYRTISAFQLLMVARQL